MCACIRLKILAIHNVGDLQGIKIAQTDKENKHMLQSIICVIVHSNDNMPHNWSTIWIKTLYKWVDLNNINNYWTIVFNSLVANLL